MFDVMFYDSVFCVLCVLCCARSVCVYVHVSNELLWCCACGHAHVYCVYMRRIVKFGAVCWEILHLECGFDNA